MFKARNLISSSNFIKRTKYSTKIFLEGKEIDIKGFEQYIKNNKPNSGDDPQKIIDDVAGACIQAGKVEGEDLIKILDRKKAIKMAIELAEKGDLVLITGKGSEQAMVVKDKLIPWDDREVVKSSIKALRD